MLPCIFIAASLATASYKYTRKHTYLRRGCRRPESDRHDSAIDHKIGRAFDRWGETFQVTAQFILEGTVT